MRPLLTIFYLLTTITISIAQEGIQVALPTIIPASPEVAQLGKLGSLSAGLHTGSANASIPLYSLAVDKVKFDISLNYSSNGVKEDEIPGVVGLSWNLLAGGVVSRTVHDEPDGSLPYWAPPANPYLKNQQTLDYLLNATKYGDTKDTEYDEYSYSFNGMSGKFFLNPATGEGYCIPHNTFKVKVYNHNGIGTKTVDIRTPEGVLYKFGITAKEETRDISIGGGGNGLISKSGFFETAWFLEQVITPEGSIISFNYSQHTIETTQGRFETFIKPQMPTAAYSCNFNCNQAYSRQFGVNLIKYVTYRLTSISTDNGQTVSFTYENRPDNSGDIRLKTITASTSLPNSTGILKRYAFEYFDPLNANSVNKKFFLTKLRTVDINTIGAGITEQSLDHSFEYFDMSAAGSRLSLGQDYFGYPNGMNNAFFAPYIASIANGIMNGSDGGNREPGSIEIRKRGILTRVNYPTGGYEEFSYEPHTISQSTASQSFSTESIGGSGLSISDPQTFVSNVFTANADQTAEILLRSFKSPAFPDDPSGEGNMLFDFKLINAVNSQILLRKKFMVYTEEIINKFLPAGTQYRIELTVYGAVNGGNATIKYNPQTNISFINKDVGGLRVYLISSFDPVSGKINNKYYKYSSFADLNSSKSSGVGPTHTISFLPYTTGTLICQGTPQAHIATCDGYMISSSSLIPVYTFGGSHIAYTNVVESDDPNYKNGLVEHFFNTYYPGVVNTTSIHGMASLNTPTNINTDLNGTEYLTRYYKKASGSIPFVLLKEIENDYSFGEVYNTRSDYFVRMRWEENHIYSPPLEDQFYGFDMIKYDYVSQWIRLSSTKTTDFDENGQNPVVSKIDYTYGNVNHLQPTRVETILSDNSLKVTENKYAHDFAQSSPINQYQKLILSNQLNRVIETKSLKGAVVLNTVKNELKEWSSGSNGIVIEPDYVFTKKTASGSEEKRIRFHKVDSDGRVLEVSKEGGQRISYIYDYSNNFPIAEVKNASLTYDSIAYTSFESDGKGYWSFSGTSISDITVPTGSRCYPLTSGDITREVNNTKTYLLTYWLKNSSGSISINGVESSKQLTVKRGWTAFEAKISNVHAITISGTGTIDELRLHPTGSLMSTMTYKPYVGISSSGSPNSLLSRYEYDGYNRLKIVRDGDDNILKQFEYTYGQNYSNPCTNTAANWATTGNQRCKIGSANNNFTGEKEREEMDMNNCSPTYTQTRWVVFSSPSECTPIPNCTGEDKRVVNGQCETGIMILTYFANINGVFHCTYHYEWLNGTIIGPDINATGAVACGAM